MLALTQTLTKSVSIPRKAPTIRTPSPLYRVSPSTLTISFQNQLIKGNLLQQAQYHKKSRAKRLPRGGFNNAGDFFVGRGILRQLEDHRALNAPPLNKKLFLLLAPGDKIALSYYNDNGSFSKFRGYVRERTDRGYRSSFTIQNLTMGIEMSFHFFSPLLHAAVVMKPTSDYVPKDLGRNFRIRKVVIDEVNNYLAQVAGERPPQIIPLKTVPKANFLRHQHNEQVSRLPHQPAPPKLKDNQ